VLSSIALANARAKDIFKNFIFAPGSGGDLSKAFGADFTNDTQTRFTTETLVKKLEDALKATPPNFPSGINTMTLSISAVLDAKATTDFVESQLIFTDPMSIPGLIAGGVGKTQVSCKVGANTTGAINDSRMAMGDVTVTKNPDGTLQVTPNIIYTVVDTLDFCPGNCGGQLAQTLTIPLSRWEASGISGDIPFSVTFPAPSLIGAFDDE
jgi:hypothetical protein